MIATAAAGAATTTGACVAGASVTAAVTATTALASLKVAATDCFAAQAGFGPDDAAVGLLAADELRALFLPLARGRASAPPPGPPPPGTPPPGPLPAGAPPPATHLAVAAKAAPLTLTLLLLPPEIITLVLCRLDAHSLSRVAATCSELYRTPPRPMTLVEEALRERAAARGHASPGRLPEGATSWAAHLAWLERRRDEAWAPVAAYTMSSFFVAEGGRLMSCGTEEAEFARQFTCLDEATGLLGHGELDANDPVVTTPTLLPSMARIRVSGISAGIGFNAAVSAAGTVYTWGVGNHGRLGHGNTEGSRVPKQVQALAGNPILSVSTGDHHCLAVTEQGEVFSWGWDTFGQCGHGGSGTNHVLPRRVEALAAIRTRSASAGESHSLVVTEEGTLYSFGLSQLLGHDNACDVGHVGEGRIPRVVDALRHVRIAAAAAGDDLSLAVTDDGTVFAWGWNQEGQLGLGRSSGVEALPQKVEALVGRKVSAVATGPHSCCAVTASGELYTWGTGDTGRLGHGDDVNQPVPKLVEALQDACVVAVSAGLDHTLAVTRDGGVFGWGRAGWLGLPDTHTAAMHNEDDAIFLLLSPRRYTQMSCVPRSGAV